MADWFIFKDVNSRLYGVHVREYPPITVAKERVKFQTIPGRSGALALLEGADVYEDVTLSLSCLVAPYDEATNPPSETVVLTDSDDTLHPITIPAPRRPVVKGLATLDEIVVSIADISAWLRGSGQLILGNQPKTCYEARVVNQIAFAKVMRGRDMRAFEVEFRCQPYRYRYPAAAARNLTDSGGTVFNPGNIYAEPLIRVYGSGDITLTLASTAGNAYTTYLTGISSSITLDVPAKIAYRNALLQAHCVSGDWPRLDAASETTVSWTGDVSRVRVTPNLRDV